MPRASVVRFLFSASLLLAPALGRAQATDAVDPQQVRELIEQNKRLQSEIEAQQKTIDDLKAKVSEVGKADSDRAAELQSLKERIEGSGSAAPAPAAPTDETVRISGELGVAFFDTGPDGAFSNGEFRIDDAKVFLDAAVWKNVYLHTELDLQTREASDNGTHLGEVFVEAENVSGQWGRDGLLNIRAGRMYVPFGEEYQVRGIMANPLISHSVSDLWGMDEGIEAYGQLSKFSYYAAVQDGGINTLHNFHTDKSIAARLAFDPASWLHLSASGMRTGRINAANDQLSAMWFGNGFFRALGPTATTTNFWANLGEVDGSVYWTGGQLKGSAGVVQFEDGNTTKDDTRHMTYYSIEAKQKLADPLYAAVRYSGIHAPGGYPLAGQGIMGEYFFGNVLTSDLERVSLGLGYQFGPPVVLKVEFSPEWGRSNNGEDRDGENLFSTELGVRF